MTNEIKGPRLGGVPQESRGRNPVLSLGPDHGAQCACLLRTSVILPKLRYTIVRTGYFPSRDWPPKSFNAGRLSKANCRMRLRRVSYADT
jgi:hypothetical protein